jgi:Protein of unknown function (DUF1569)
MDSVFDKTRIAALLRQIAPDAVPDWGLMTPQHMVEHLAFGVCMSNGKQPQPLMIPAEKVEKAQSRLFDPLWRMPSGFKAAFMPEDRPLPLEKTDYEAAIEALLIEIDDFEQFFDKNPDTTPTHPYFGDLNRAGWLVLHHKHFSHHLRQFGLI